MALMAQVRLTRTFDAKRYQNLTVRTNFALRTQLQVRNGASSCIHFSCICVNHTAVPF